MRYIETIVDIITITRNVQQGNETVRMFPLKNQAIVRIIERKESYKCRFRFFFQRYVSP